MIDKSKNAMQQLSDKDDLLRIEDLVRYLVQLAKINEDPRIGNIELSSGILSVAEYLRPYSRKPIKDLGVILSREAGSDFILREQRRLKIDLPEDLKNVPVEVVCNIINDDNFTKNQIVDLGFERFGIPKSKLSRLNKQAVIEAIQSALNHENSLDVISFEARRGGEKRSS